MRKSVAPTSRSLSVSERVTALEAAWDNAWDGIGDKIALAVARAASEFTPAASHANLDSEVKALRHRIDALENRNSFAAGATKVETRQETQLQEWARTLTPLVFGLGFTLVGSLWALQQGG